MLPTSWLFAKLPEEWVSVLLHSDLRVNQHRLDAWRLLRPRKKVGGLLQLAGLVKIGRKVHNLSLLSWRDKEE